MHIHIPDGVLPIWLWLGGYLIAAVFLAFMLPKIKKEIKKIPFVGMIAALMLLIMSVPLGLPTHLNLMVLAGILVGAPWSLMVAFVVNLILASFGHGGLTIVGLNTLLLWSQALLGILIFNLLVKIFRNCFAPYNHLWGAVRGFAPAGIAAFIAIFVSFLLLVGIVAAARINPAVLLPHEHLEHDEHTEQNHKLELPTHTQISIKTFAILTFPIMLWGALIESLITGFVAQFIKKVKPELLGIGT